MPKEGFENYKVGDCLTFFAEVYRYVKTGNGKRIDFALRNPQRIKKIDSYELPTDDELMLQSIDAIICETCYLNEHCGACPHFRTTIIRSFQTRKSSKLPLKKCDIFFG